MGNHHGHGNNHINPKKKGNMMQLRLSRGRSFLTQWGCNFLALALVACGGGGGDTSPSPSTGTGTIIGVVASNTTGTPIAGATVTVGTSTATTGTDGSYTLTGIAVTTRAVVNISANTYANGSKVTAVFANSTSRADAALLPVAYTATINPSTAQTVAVPSSSAIVSLPANGLRTSGNAAPSGNVSVSVTPIDPSSNPQIMPGDFATNDGGQIESFGAMDVSMSDAAGASINLAAGQSSTVRIPVAAGSSPTSTMDMWYYNSTTGQWVNEGTLTLFGTAPNQYYQGTVTHFSTWNADKRLSTTCVTGRVVDVNGASVGNARVESEGQGYVGTSTAYSAADGSFTIKIKALASAILTAKTATAQSNSTAVTGGVAGTTCTAMTTNLTLGSTTAGSATIKLTWGTNPSDLDSHLTIPIAGSTSRTHVYFGNPGSLTAAPYAKLDVDDMSSFGPEVITINRFIPGRYRYSVHHWSGTSTILASPARVELTLNGVTRVFTPPAGSPVSGSVWVVMELNVDSAGSVTVTPVNTYSSASTNPYYQPASSTVTKPPLVGDNWQE